MVHRRVLRLWGAWRAVGGHFRRRDVWRTRCAGGVDTGVGLGNVGVSPRRARAQRQTTRTETPALPGDRGRGLPRWNSLGNLLQATDEKPARLARDIRGHEPFLAVFIVQR